jgi:hypothetical protein
MSRTLGALAWRAMKWDEEACTIPVLHQIHLGSEDHISSTPIIDAVLGISDISLETALDINHAPINMYDSSGYTAMH